MTVLAALALTCSLARAAAAPLAAGTTAPAQVPAGAAASSQAAEAETLTQNAKTLLDDEDLKTALTDAEAAVAAGGGADAYAARAEAKLALGRPLEEVIADYAEAARLDPRFGAKYRGFVARLQSQAQPARGKGRTARGAGGVSMILVFGMGAAGVAILLLGLVFLRRKKSVGKSASEL